MSAQIRPASAGRAYDAPPQLTQTGSRTWITRGANFVVAMSAVEPGAVLSRSDHPDEYMVLLGGVAATIKAGAQTIEAAPESLTIVPPGPSEVVAKGAGHGLRGRSATLGLRHGPDSYGRQQWGILRNARKRDAATPRGGRRPSGCKPLSVGTKLRR